MKLSTRMRYGTRAMLDLALHHDDGPLSAGEIAARQELSLKYLETVLGRLRIAGLVRSTRGSNGGYELARAPAHISMRDLFDVLEGVDGYAPCTGDHSVCDRRATCVTQEVWGKMFGASMVVLESVTLADLVAGHRAKQCSACDATAIRAGSDGVQEVECG